MAAPAARVVAVPWDEAVLICARCARRQHRADKKGRTELRRELKRALRDTPHRRARVLEVGCLGLCPKQGQVVARAAQLVAGQLVVLDGKADGEAAAAALFGG